MQLLFDAVSLTIENGGPVGEEAPASVPSSSSSPPWQQCFPNGASDWVPITMLPAAQWRALLHDAGFDVGGGGNSDRGSGGSRGGVLRERVVETTYADAAGAYERYAAAWGPMFPTLPTTPLRNAFFRDVAATAAHLGSTALRASARASDADSSGTADGDGGRDRAGAIVVRNLMVDIAVPARPL
ncbi:unnamed protein product [Prorocentrum cordatum]|uniref:Uncharacterized protein n=1 Tax=Prorocentrum cordatum TaxID=2364126 RepID=A0ABN9YIJ5_9DINO|nr:unnamed protein product [Polarella glacialis]